MPDPKKFKDKQKWMAECMHQVKKVEGKPQDQAVAICLSQWRNKDKKKKASIISSRLDKLASTLEEKGLKDKALQINIMSKYIDKGE